MFLNVFIVLILYLVLFYKYKATFLVCQIFFNFFFNFSENLEFQREPRLYIPCLLGFKFFLLVAGLGVEPSISSGYEPGMIFRFTHPQ